MTSDPKGRDPEGRDPQGQHLPRPHDSSELRMSCRSRSSGLAVRPCQTRQRLALLVCDALVVENLPFAAKVAAIGGIKASTRFDDKRINNSKCNFNAYARPFVNGEITHYLRDKKFFL